MGKYLNDSANNLCTLFGFEMPILVWPGVGYQSIELVGHACEAGA